MRTTIELSDPLFKKAKALADKRGLSFRRLVEEALRRYISDEKPARFEFRDLSFRGDGLVPGLDWSNWERIRESAYEGRGG